MFMHRHENEMSQMNAKKLAFVPPRENLNMSGNNNNESNTQLQHYYHLCKSFVHQMGLLSWEKRQLFNILHKSPQLLRELKSLDDQTW